MKKFLKISLVAVIVIAVAIGSALLYGRLSSMSELRVEHPEIALGPLPLSLTQIGEVAPGMPFRIDTGSSVNTISRKYLKMLEQRGFPVDSSYVLTYVRTAYGNNNRIATKRFRVSMPVYAYDIEFDGGKVISRIDTTNQINRVDGMDFVLTSSDTEIPRLGRPFFRKFFMEYDHDIRVVRFHTSMPEGYEEINGLSNNLSVFSDPAMFLTLTVDGREQDFFLNTSMPRAGILKPLDEAPEVDGKNVYEDVIPSIFGKKRAVIDYNAWVEWNDRAGSNVCYYSNYGSKPYAINLFNFLTQDAVFDFADCKVFLRPTAERYRRVRSNDAFAQTAD